MKKLLEQLKILLLQLRVLLLKEKLTIPNLDNPKHIIIHHGGGNLTFEQVDICHRRKWGFKSSLNYYIGYHYFISIEGIVYQGRADNEEGAHCVEEGKPHYWNRNSIGICLMGNGEEKDFTLEQYLVLKKLINRKRIQYEIPYSEVYGHRNFSSTICPSDRLYNWLVNYKN